MVVSGYSFLLPSIPHVHSPLFSSLYPVSFSPPSLLLRENIPPPSTTFDSGVGGEKLVLTHC